MNSTARALIALLSAGLVAGAANAQSSVRIDPPKGGLGWLTRPYQQRYVPPINLVNSSRFDSLIRAGNLYLPAQDVIALALENNIDIEVQRYGPLLAREVVATCGKRQPFAQRRPAGGRRPHKRKSDRRQREYEWGALGRRGRSQRWRRHHHPAWPDIPVFRSQHLRVRELSARHFAAEPHRRSREPTR